MNVVQNAMVPNLITKRCQLRIDGEQLREIPQGKNRVFVQMTIAQAIRSMMVLVEERQIVSPRNVIRASEESEAEARGVWRDGPESTIACDYVVIEELVQTLSHFVQCWRCGIDQRGWEEWTEEWAGLVKRALSMSYSDGGDKYNQSNKRCRLDHVEVPCLRGCEVVRIIVTSHTYLYRSREKRQPSIKRNYKITMAPLTLPSLPTA